MPVVSVIIPTFSRPHLLPRAVESARAASKDAEIIVVDDASADSTAEVCRRLGGVTYIRLERNQRVAGARNVGLLATTCEYVAFLDDDDQRLPGSLDLQIETLARNPDAGFCCGPALFADEEGSLTGERASPRFDLSGDEIFWSLMGWDFFTLPVAIVARKSAILQAGLLKSSLAGLDDWDLWVRLAELFPVVTVDQPVGVYRRPTPRSRQGSSDFARDSLRALRQQNVLMELPRAQAATPQFRRSIRQLTKRRFADVLFQRAARWWPQGYYKFAAKHFLTGLRLSPLRALRPFVYRELYNSYRQHDPARAGGEAAAHVGHDSGKRNNSRQP